MGLNWTTKLEECKGCGEEFQDYFGSRGFCEECIVEVEEEEREDRHAEVDADYGIGRYE